MRMRRPQGSGFVSGGSVFLLLRLHLPFGSPCPAVHTRETTNLWKESGLHQPARAGAVPGTSAPLAAGPPGSEHISLGLVFALVLSSWESRRLKPSIVNSQDSSGTFSCLPCPLRLPPSEAWPSRNQQMLNFRFAAALRPSPLRPFSRSTQESLGGRAEGTNA